MCARTIVALVHIRCSFFIYLSNIACTKTISDEINTDINDLITSYRSFQLVLFVNQIITRSLLLNETLLRCGFV